MLGAVRRGRPLLGLRMAAASLLIGQSSIRGNMSLDNLAAIFHLHEFEMIKQTKEKTKRQKQIKLTFEIN